MEAPQEHSYGAPEQIEPKTLGDYLDVMSKVVFQSGMSWKVVNSKWPGIRDAFHDFDAIAVAAMPGSEIAALQKDPRVIRNARKIDAVQENAQTMIELEETHGGFENYLRSLGGFEPTVKDLCKRFKFMGDFGAFYFLYVVGEPVPSYEDWCASRGRSHDH